MKQTHVSLDQERNLIINLITNTQFCTRIVPILQPKQLKSKYGKIVAQWIIEYFNEYKTAPNELIQNIYNERKNSILDDEVGLSVQEFLISLSEESDKQPLRNVEYVEKQAETYLKIRSLELHEEEIKAAIVANDPIRGEAAISNYNRVGMPNDESVSIMEDKGMIIDSFIQENEYLFTFRGALDTTIGKPMRGDLFTYLGKPKGKKSFALQFTAEEAAYGGNNVTFVSLEMRRPQLLRRAWTSLNGRSLYDREVDIPYFDQSVRGATPKDDMFTVERKVQTIKGLDLMDIDKFQIAQQRLANGGGIRYVTFPAYSATVEDIIAYLDVLEHFDGYLTDVLVVDYADLIRPGKNAGNEYRHQIDYIWKSLRALAQARNILVVTASQTNRDGLTGDIQLENVAEDVRKLTHVSILVALNQNKAEKMAGVMRLCTLLKRDDETGFDDEAVVLQQLAIGKFYLDSKLVRNVERIDDH